MDDKSNSHKIAFGFSKTYGSRFIQTDSKSLITKNKINLNHKREMLKLKERKGPWSGIKGVFSGQSDENKKL